MRWQLRLAASGMLAWLAGCGAGTPQPEGVLSGYRLVDLTHPFDERTVFWPTGQPFRHSRTAWGEQPGGYWYSAYDISLSEHCGTHLDAPIHFAEGGSTASELDLGDLSGPLAVVDIRQASQQEADYAASAADIGTHESGHGAISSGMVVLFRTGWSTRWPDRLRYLGDDTPGRADALHFPGISEEASRWLAERDVKAVGIDTASIDPGASADFPAHRVLAAAGIPVFENVAKLEDVPARGAHLLAFPMKIGGGSGAPARIAALVPENWRPATPSVR